MNSTLGLLAAAMSGTTYRLNVMIDEPRRRGGHGGKKCGRGTKGAFGCSAMNRSIKAAEITFEDSLFIASTNRVRKARGCQLDEETILRHRHLASIVAKHFRPFERTIYRKPVTK